MPLCAGSKSPDQRQRAGSVNAVVAVSVELHSTYTPEQSHHIQSREIEAMEDDPWASAAPAGPSSPRPASPGQTHASVQASEINGLDDLSLADPADPFAASSSPVRLAEPSIDAAVNAQGGMDDFDEFDEPASGGPSGAALGDEGMDDEGFGDFGDFEEGDFEEAVAVAPNPIPPQVPADTSWVSMTARHCRAVFSDAADFTAPRILA